MNRCLRRSTYGKYLAGQKTTIRNRYGIFHLGVGKLRPAHTVTLSRREMLLEKGGMVLVLVLVLIMILG